MKKNLITIDNNYDLQPHEFDKIDALIDHAYTYANINKMGNQTVEEYKENLKLTPFNEGNFSKKNFLKGEQKTPHRIFRQVMMQLDDRLHTWMQCKERHAQTEIQLHKYILQICRFKKLKELKQPVDIVGLKNIETKVNKLTQDDIRMSPDTKENVKKELQLSAPPAHSNFTFDDVDDEYYSLEILELKSKIRECRLQQAQTAKLFKDTAIEIDTLQKERDKFKPFVDKLEKNGIDFEAAENVYWNRRFGENCKIRQFVNCPMLNVIDDNGKPIIEKEINYLVSESERKQKRDLIEGKDFIVSEKQKTIYFEKAKDLDTEQIKAIIQTPKLTREKIFKSLGLPPNLKEILKIENDEDDTLDNIVENYKSWLSITKEDLQKNSTFQASDY